MRIVVGGGSKYRRGYSGYRRFAVARVPDDQVIFTAAIEVGRYDLCGLPAGRQRAHQAAHLRVSAAAAPEAVANQLVSALEGTVRVNLAERAYHVEVRAGALDDVVLHLPPGATRVALLADRAVRTVSDRLVASLRSSGISTTLEAMVTTAPKMVIPSSSK